MTLLESILKTEREMIVITDHHTKMHVLKSLSEMKVFKAMRFLTSEDLLSEVFFKKDPFLSYHLSMYLSKKSSLVNSLIPYLYFIDTKQSYITERLNLLKTIKLYLLNQHLITLPAHSDLLFKDKTIYYSLDYFPLKSLIDKKLAEVNGIETDSKYKPLNETVSYKRFQYYKDEIADIAHDINALLQQDVPLNKIKVVYTNDTYLPAIKEIFEAFKLPYFLQDKTPLKAFEPTKRLIAYLKAIDDKPLYDQINEALEHLKSESKKPLNPRIMTKLIQTLNPFVLLNKPFKDLKTIIYDTLENTMIPSLKSPGIITCSLSEAFNEPSEYLFILGAAETLFPAYKKEDSFLSKDEKLTIGYPTASSENVMIKKALLDALKSIKHVTLSYSQKGLTDTFYEATFLEDIKSEFSVSVKEKTPRQRSSFGMLYDKITTKIELDYYKRYGEEHPHLKDHYHLFKEAYVPYDNQFKGISQKTLESIIKVPLRLSYTKLNTYFKCKFRYLIEYLLNVKEDTDTLALDMGTFFHAVLEKYIHQDLLTETMLDETLNDVLVSLNRNYHAKEQFFLKNSYNTLKKVFETIKDQHARSNYALYKQEFKLNTLVEAAVPVEFNGIIDKIMLSDDQQGAVIIDYKTGKPTLKLSHSYYGFDSQLVFYALLLEKALGGAQKVHGFYEQTIFPRPFNKDPKATLDEQFDEALKLNGYTINNLDHALKIDPSLESGSFIKGMRVKKDGSFMHYTKVFDEAALNALTKHLEALISEAINDILTGDFKINPKQDEAFNDLSCTYCPFKDVCYKKNEDYVTLKIPKDDETLFDWVKEAHHGSD